MSSTFSTEHHTRCPECDTVFRINSKQLAAAAGKVRCGHCKHVFNALDHITLLDNPLSPPPVSEPQPKPDFETTAPQEIITDEILQKLADDETGQAQEETTYIFDSDAEPDNSSEEIEISEPVLLTEEDEEQESDAVDETAHEEIVYGTLAEPEIEEIELATPAESDIELEQEDATGEPETADDELPSPPPATDEEIHAMMTPGEESEPPPAKTAEDSQAQEEEIPYALRESLLAAQQSPLSAKKVGLQVGIILFLCVVLTWQLIIFRGAELGQRFAMLKPLVNIVCENVECRYTGARDVSQVRLISRDIRALPERKGSLLITATMVNEASFLQPYPDFKVILSDLTGTIVASRRFTPEEYLGQLVKQEFLMQPGRPVQVALEVLDPGSDAVNFEIIFL